MPARETADARHRGTTDRVLMIRPVRFGPNPETAASNAFQQGLGDAAPEAVQRRAAEEFDGLAAALRGRGVTVLVRDDTLDPPAPDAVFPNNWVSFHEDGTAVLYPMEAPSRRREVRRDLVEELALRSLDLTAYQDRGLFLEGTGSLVLDRRHGIAYAALSSRTSPAMVDEVARRMGWRTVAFRAVDARGAPVYHTNVVMSVGAEVAVVCLDAVADAAERATVETTLIETGHAVVPISLEQMARFAGNILELRDGAGRPLLVMSRTAHDAFTPEQRARLSTFADLVHAPLETLERYGGGSARCMLAEVFPPERADP